MKSKLNKKFLQLISALWILFFHLYFPMTGLQAEDFILKIGYVGVDLFFFLAAYSMNGKEIVYKDFIINRFKQVYIMFVFFAIFATIWKKYNMVRLLKIVIGIDLLEKGGGAFLWFLPAIMLVYLIFPFFIKWKWKYKGFVVIAVWLITVIVLEHALKYSTLSIFLNRIPVMIVGYYWKNVEAWFSKQSERLVQENKIKPGLIVLIVGVCFTLLGGTILYFFGYVRRVSFPVKNIYFVFGIPMVLGLVILSSFIKDSKVLTFLASATMEMYALQMIIGPNVFLKIYQATKSPLITNIGVLIITCVLSLAVANLKKVIFQLPKKIAKK